MLRITSALALLLATSACASATGNPYNLQPEVIRMSQSQVVIYRTGGGIPVPAPTLTINGVERCDIASGGYTVLNVKPNQTVRLRLKRLGDIYPSEVTFQAGAGQRKFVEVSFNQGGMFAHSFTGLVGGSLIDQRGSFVFADGNESDARSTSEDVTCRR